MSHNVNKKEMKICEVANMQLTIDKHSSLGSSGTLHRKYIQ